MRNRPLSIRPLFLTALFAVLALGSDCYRGEPPAYNGNYPEYLDRVTPLLCNKMLTCYRKVTRTMSVESSRKLTVEECTKSTLQNLDEKLSKNSEGMVNLSVRCYTTLLKTPCRDLEVVGYLDPACRNLRELSAAAFQE